MAITGDGAGEADGAITPRQRRILNIVKEQGFATVETLARQFSVSAQTVRRDIIRLDAVRLLQRFHGGAGMRGSTVRLGYAEKCIVAADAKERIGRAVSAAIPDRASVFLDVGTTVEAVARALGMRQGLHVFTNSLAAGSIVASSGANEVFVTGGIVGGPDGSLVGAATTASLARFKVDYAIIGFSGFDDDGALMDFDLRKVAVKQAAMAHARRVLAAADASKFARSAIVRIAPVSAVQALVTDAPPPPWLRERFEAEGVDIMVAA